MLLPGQPQSGSVTKGGFQYYEFFIPEDTDVSCWVWADVTIGANTSSLMDRIAFQRADGALRTHV